MYTGSAWTSWGNLVNTSVSVPSNILTKKLLWTNSSPGSAFAAQDVVVSCSSYDFIEIVASCYGGASSFTLTSSGMVPYLSSNNGFLTDSHTRTWITRSFKLYSNAVSFFDAQWAYFISDSLGTTDNAYMIPYKVYGYKIE